MLFAIASRFEISENEITTDADLTNNDLLDPDMLLIIPDRISEPTIKITMPIIFEQQLSFTSP
ncbi:MAG: hypothetical protein QY332_15800 [Anaerolineales bacterium]|nr:MAG: hypothetical protein QY332_15800 [Anaerolineales bacterium]